MVVESKVVILGYGLRRVGVRFDGYCELFASADFDCVANFNPVVGIFQKIVF